MKTVSKFIINRDDNAFFYVEKHRLSKKSNKMKYYVHSSPENVVVYSDHAFHDIHSLDEKISVNLFLKKAADRLVTELSDNKCFVSYNLLSQVYEKTKNDSNEHNPKLKGIKHNLLKGLKIYNEVFLELGSVSIPYEENYELLHSGSEKVYTKEKVKSISSLVTEKEIIETNEEIYTIPVKELVRKKKSA